VVMWFFLLLAGGLLSHGFQWLGKAVLCLHPQALFASHNRRSCGWCRSRNTRHSTISPTDADERSSTPEVDTDVNEGEEDSLIMRDDNAGTGNSRGTTPLPGEGTAFVRSRRRSDSVNGVDAVPASHLRCQRTFKFLAMVAFAIGVAWVRRHPHCCWWSRFLASFQYFPCSATSWLAGGVFCLQSPSIRLFSSVRCPHPLHHWTASRTPTATLVCMTPLTSPMACGFWLSRIRLQMTPRQRSTSAYVWVTFNLPLRCSCCA
jgi:hypothetical protein